MNTHEMAELLPFYDKLTREETIDAQSAIRLAKYRAGAIVHNSGDDCLGLLVITKGVLRASVISDEGREVTLFRLHSGDVCILTASCVISQITFDTEVVAEEDSEAVVLAAPKLLSLTKSNVYVESFIYKLATERFSDVMWTLQQILFMGVDKRLAVFLYDEYARTGSVSIKTTHEQLARNIGSAREVVTRMLNRFVDDGIVELSRGTITLTDTKALKMLAM